jgi:hypothetical protein
MRKTYPSLAYAPTWLPASYHYGGYSPGKFFVLTFGNRQYPDALSRSVFKAAPHSPNCRRPNAMATFRMNHVTVYWEGTYGDQQAYRCLTRAGTTIVLTASASIPGDDSNRTPKQRHDAYVLAKAIAYAEPLR